jgi:hypothetical protein
MSNFWLHRIKQNPNDASLLGQALADLESLAASYAHKIDVKGHNIIGVAGDIPDLSVKVHMYWSELDAIHEVIAMHRLIALGQARQHFTEVYKRALSATQAEKYAEIDAAVIAWDSKLIEIDFVRNQWDAVSKGLARLHYQISTIAEMRRLGFDASII